MAEGEPGDSQGAFFAVAIVVGAMALTVLVGAVTLAIIAPELVDTTLEGFAGEGRARPGVVLFVVQIIVFVAVSGGLLAFTWRMRRRGGPRTPPEGRLKR